MSERRSCVIRTFPLEWQVQAQIQGAGSALGLGQPWDPTVSLCLLLLFPLQICLYPAWLEEEQDFAKPHSLPLPEEVETQLQVLSHLCLCSKILPPHGSILRSSTAVTISWLNTLNSRDIPQKQKGRTERCHRDGQQPGTSHSLGASPWILQPFLPTCVTQQRQTQKKKNNPQEFLVEKKKQRKNIHF